MKQKVKLLIKHPLIYGGGILIIGSIIANFFNFLFYLFMSRNLSNANYGEIATVISLMAFPSLIANALVPIAIQFAGKYYATNQIHMVRGLYFKLGKFFAFLGISTFLIFIILIYQIGAFLHINNLTVFVITDFIIFLTFLGTINLAFIQAKLAFSFQVFLIILGALLKLLLGIAVIMFGLSVEGVLFAMLLATFLTYVISFAPIKFVFDKTISNPPIDTKELFYYGFPTTLTLIGLTSLQSIDILLVKHFFNPTQAGIYASLSLVGKVIFYFSAPIGTVMFPLIVQKHNKKQNLTNTFLLSLLIVVVPSLLLTVLYFIFPKIIILFFSKKTENLVVSPILGYFGISMSFYCLLTIIANFYLSIKKTLVFIPVIAGAALQILLIYFLHQSFLQIIIISLSISFLLVIILLLYYPYATKKSI